MKYQRNGALDYLDSDSPYISMNSHFSPPFPHGFFPNPPAAFRRFAPACPRRTTCRGLRGISSDRRLSAVRARPQIPGAAAAELFGATRPVSPGGRSRTFHAGCGVRNVRNNVRGGQ